MHLKVWQVFGRAPRLKSDTAYGHLPDNLCVGREQVRKKAAYEQLKWTIEHNRQKE
jgi:hypothetical protein